MNRISSGILAILFLLGVPAGAQSGGASKGKQKAPAVKASLDTLVSRVDAYWSALIQKKKGQAAEYVAAADRDRFYNSNPPPFSNPHLKSLELSADRKEAMVTVVVVCITQFGTKMDWPVTDRWRFEKGNWYRTLSAKSRGLLPGMEREETSTGKDVEALKNEIRKLLVIQNPVLDFGTVRGPTPLDLPLKYTLGGKESVGAVVDAPAGFGVQGGKYLVLNPGEHELRITVPTWQLDGVVNERIVLTVRRPGVSVPFEINVKGNVYVPVSIAPKRLKFQKEESEKEVRIRNNTKFDLELLPAFSETRQVLVQPLPATVSPGQEIVLKVKLSKNSASYRPSLIDPLAIPFAKPVDGVSSLTLNVVLNAADSGKDGEKAGAKGEDPLIPSDKSKNCKAPPDIFSSGSGSE